MPIDSALKKDSELCQIDKSNCFYTSTD